MNSKSESKVCKFTTHWRMSTYRVDDSLGLIWDEALLTAGAAWQLRFPAPFLKNPRHPAYKKLLAQLTFLLDALLPYASHLQKLRWRTPNLFQSCTES